MSMIINKNWMWRFFLVLAFFDTVTRFSFSDDLSPYRIAAIVVLIPFLIKHVAQYGKSLCVLFATLAYSTVLIALEHGNQIASIDQFVHILFIYGIYVAVRELSKTEESKRDLYRLIDCFTIIEIAVFLFEIITGILLFQSKISKDKASVFSWGINDFVVSIIIPAIIYIVLFFKNRKATDLLKYIAVFAVTIFAGARASIIVLLFAFIISFFWFRVARHLNSVFSKLLAIFLLGTIAVVLLYVINPVIDNADVRTLIFTPVMSMLSLDSADAVGSIGMRLSALIMGINKLIETYGFGVGLGNINAIIAVSDLRMRTMHNILMQFIVELGWLMVLFIIMIIKRAIRDLKLSFRNHNTDGFTELLCLLLFPLISVQSSGGVMSCYIMWTCFFFVMLPGSVNNAKAIVENTENNDMTVGEMLNE